MSENPRKKYRKSDILATYARKHAKKVLDVLREPDESRVKGEIREILKSKGLRFQGKAAKSEITDEIDRIWGRVLDSDNWLERFEILEMELGVKLSKEDEGRLRHRIFSEFLHAFHIHDKVLGKELRTLVGSRFIKKDEDLKRYYINLEFDADTSQFNDIYDDTVFMKGLKDKSDVKPSITIYPKAKKMEAIAIEKTIRSDAQKIINSVWKLRDSDEHYLIVIRVKREKERGKSPRI